MQLIEGIVRNQLQGELDYAVHHGTHFAFILAKVIKEIYPLIPSIFRVKSHAHAKQGFTIIPFCVSTTDKNH